MPIPYLRKTSGGAQLVVDGTPTLLLGGQVHNSAPSSPSHMRAIFDRLESMHVSTVIGSASWAMIEPDEGSFDFSHVDAQISEARARGMRLVMIWFGAFKNAASTYAPRWVRADTHRFPRAVVNPAGNQVEAFSYPGAMPKPVLSVFSPQLVAADKAAFTELMRHLAVADPGHVVVMVQVENEIGLLQDSRDRSRSGCGSPVRRLSWPIWRPTPTGCARSWPGCGLGQDGPRREHGSKCSATTGRPRSCSWRGPLPATSSHWPQRARR